MRYFALALIAGAATALRLSQDIIQGKAYDGKEPTDIELEISGEGDGFSYGVLRDETNGVSCDVELYDQSLVLQTCDGHDMGGWTFDFEFEEDIE